MSNISSPYRTYKDVKKYAERLNIEVTRIRGGYEVIECNKAGATTYVCETLEEVFGAIREIRSENT